MTLDLEAIRLRNEARKVHDVEDRGAAYLAGKRDDDFDREHVEFYESACSDVDTLLAEVERLQAENDRFRNRCSVCGYEYETADCLAAHPCVDIIRQHTGPELAEKIRKFNGGGK